MISKDLQDFVIKTTHKKDDGLVYLASRDRLERFRECYPSFVFIRNSKDPSFCLAKDEMDRQWQFCVLNDNCRGFKPGRVIIDATVDEDALRCIALPCMIFCHHAEFFE